jgi:phi13 family phage major tail protein
MATRIGCDSLHYAAMTTEDTAAAAPVYATAPTAAPGVMSIKINPNGTLDTLFADDGPMESASTLGKIEVEIQKNQLTTANKADLLGHQVDANKALVYGDSDTPPWMAILFRTLKSNGNYRYVCLYKGKFAEPEDDSETKGDTLSFQSDTIKGQFVKLNFAYTVGTKSVRPWKYEADQDDTGVATTVFTTWFTKVPMPNATQA